MSPAETAGLTAYLQAAAAFAILIVTVVYVLLTKRMSEASAATVRAMREQQLSASQPLVAAEAELDPPGAQSVELGPGEVVMAMAGTSEYTVPSAPKVSIENVGNGPALAVGVVASWGDVQFEAPSRLAYLTTAGHRSLVLKTKQFNGSRRITTGNPPFVLTITYEDIYHRQFVAKGTYSLSPANGATLVDFQVAFHQTLTASVTATATTQAEVIALRSPTNIHPNVQGTACFGSVRKRRYGGWANRKTVGAPRS